MSHDISALTLAQKASLLSGQGFWTTKAIEDAGIPSIMLTDGPHGIRRQDGAADHLGINDALPATCFPPAVAVGSSWDPEVAAEVGAALGREALAAGVSVVLGPGVNIKRSPLCGRNFEYYSEDPLLSGVLGSAHVQAMQRVGPGASVKHFAANNQEHERMRISAEVDERTLREIYLPAFERVVTEAAPATVMAAYNKVNGVPASHSPWLLTDVLRTEWGFQGAVVSDWGAVSDRVAGVAAGMDLEMPGRGVATDQEIVDAVRSGRLSEEQVDVAVHRVLALTDLPHRPTGTVDVDAHHELARTLAADSVVLLKNDRDVLPVTTVAHMAVIGPLAVEPRFQGGGSSHINPTRVDAALDRIRDHARQRGMAVEYAEGYLLGDDMNARARCDVAADLATRADLAIVFAGLSEREESEGFDRETLSLPAEQIEVIKAVAAAAPRTVVVLSNGGVVSLEGWHDQVDGILEGWLLGQAGGSAIADVLFGVVNPSGHLAETIPFRVQDNPSWHNFPGEQGHVRYGEGVMVGYRHYESAGIPVRYPFGHGLSYTTFRTSNLRVESVGTDSASVQVTITNTGERAGKHVVQVYVATEAGPVRRPVRELRAFAKAALEPGETTTVGFTLDRRAFAYWDITLGQWVVPAGDYVIQIGENASSIVAEQSIALTGDVIVRPLTLESPVGEWLSHPAVGPAMVGVLSSGTADEEPVEVGLRMVESMPMQQFLAFTGGAFPMEMLEHMMELSTAGTAAV